MKDLTYIKVKEGKLWASDEIRYALNSVRALQPHPIETERETYGRLMEAFNQSFVEVGNPEFMHQLLPVKGAELVEGIQPVSGLQFKYRIVCDEPCGGSCGECKHAKKVAILSLKQEQKEQEPDVGHDDFESASKKVYSKLLSPLKQEQPYRLERPVEGGTLGTEFGAQEQPSEEKEGEEIKCTACDGKGWLPHVTPSPVEGEKEEPREREFRITKNYEDGTSEVTCLRINGEKWVKESEQASRIKALEERLDDIDTFLALEEDASHGDYGRLVTHLRGKILDKLKH